MSDSPLKTCPKCGKGVRRLIGGGAAIIFKGSGFYVTDNKKGSGGDAKKTKDGDTKPAAAESASASTTSTEKSASTEKKAGAEKSSSSEKKETKSTAKNSA
jgi:predicted nucleic acid-binding Zn ribbon protein